MSDRRLLRYRRLSILQRFRDIRAPQALYRRSGGIRYACGRIDALYSILVRFKLDNEHILC
jgi:hypothetical protein